MIKIENTAVFGWEAAIRGMSVGKGVRRTGTGTYEAYVSCHGKFLSCGTYPTESQAQDAVSITKIKLFEAGVISHGDNPNEIVESVIPGYFASPNGNIYNRHGEIMVGAIDRCGYRQVIIGRKSMSVHRVIAETFIKNSENKPCVNHKNGDKLNNKVENLEWCTYSENTSHSYRNRLQTISSNRYGTYRVLGEDDIEFIRRARELGYKTDRQVAEVIGCTRELVGRKRREMGL